MIKRFAAFSGFESAFVESTRRYLGQFQVLPIFLKLSPSLEESYFRSLASQMLRVIEDPRHSDIQIEALLVSCIEDQKKSALERDFFFPALQKYSVPASFRKDISRSRSLADKIITIFKSEQFATCRRITRPAHNATGLLPLRNTKVRQLDKALGQLYDGLECDIHNTTRKYVLRRKGGNGFRIGQLDFIGRTNSASHPVRKMTDTDRCNLSARMRLGHSVPARFEFDVTCERGLRGHVFSLCCGTDRQIHAPAVTHLNMRINDDFDEG